jgi:hypothetical protein
VNSAVGVRTTMTKSSLPADVNLPLGCAQREPRGATFLAGAVMFNLMRPEMKGKNVDAKTKARRR